MQFGHSMFFIHDLRGEITCRPFSNRDLLVRDNNYSDIEQVSSALHSCCLNIKVFEEIHLVNFITIEIRTHFNILPQTVVIFLYFINPGHLVHTKVHSFLC